MCRVKFELGNVCIFEESDWNKMTAFIVNNLSNFEHAFKPEIDTIKNKKTAYNIT